MARCMEALTVERGGFQPELAPHRETFITLLRKAAADAWKSGALYCGCMAESFGGDTPITGSVTVSLAGGRTSKGDPLPTDPAAIADRR